MSAPVYKTVEPTVAMNLAAITYVVIDADSDINIASFNNEPLQVIRYYGNAPTVIVHDPILRGIGWDANGAPEVLYTGESFEWVMREVGT